MKNFMLRLVAYICLALICLGGWRLANAQSRTVCQQQGTQVVCTTVPQVQVPVNPGFDSSVIGGIGNSNQLSPEVINYLWIKKCIKLGVKEGLTDDEIRARCFR